MKVKSFVTIHERERLSHLQENILSSCLQSAQMYTITSYPHFTCDGMGSGLFDMNVALCRNSNVDDEFVLWKMRCITTSLQHGPLILKTISQEKCAFLPWATESRVLWNFPWLKDWIRIGEQIKIFLDVDNHWATACAENSWTGQGGSGHWITLFLFVS